MPKSSKWLFPLLLLCLVLNISAFSLGALDAAPAAASEEECETEECPEESTDPFFIKYPEVVWARQMPFGGMSTGPETPYGENHDWNYSVSAGAFPTGMYVNKSTGTIEGPINGDAANTETFHVKIKATKEEETVESNYFAITVFPKEPQIQLRPILLFDQNEKWRPLNVNEFLEENFGSKEEPDAHEICNEEDECTPLSTTNRASNEEAFSTLTENEEHIDVHGNGESAEYYSPNPECVGEIVLDCETGPETALYWHMLPKIFWSGEGWGETNRYYDYWAFYRYNEYTFFPGSGNHEGDWEGLVISSDAEGGVGNPYGFEWVGMAAHDDVWRYLNGTLYCDYKEIPGSCKKGVDGVKGQRVMAYIAEGDHATYPRPCSSECLRTESSLKEDFVGEEDFDGKANWAANEEPNTLVELTASENVFWSIWLGSWDGDDNVASPLHQNRAIEPWNYYTSCTERYNEPFESEEVCPTEKEEKEKSKSSSLNFESESRNICSAWSGPFVQVSICDPEELRESFRDVNSDDKSTVKLVSAKTGASTGVDAAPGIAQLVSEKPVPIGSPVKIEGKITPQDLIRVVTIDNQGSKVVATFKGLHSGGGIHDLVVSNSQKAGISATITYKHNHKKRYKKLKVKRHREQPQRKIYQRVKAQ